MSLWGRGSNADGKMMACEIAGLKHEDDMSRDNKVRVTREELHALAMYELRQYFAANPQLTLSTVRKGVGTYIIEVEWAEELIYDAEDCAKVGQSLYERYVVKAC